jgi:fatty acid desaturase
MKKSPNDEGNNDAEPPRVHTLHDIINSDLTAPRNEFVFRTPVLSGMLQRHLKDERDEPMAHLIANILVYNVVFLSSIIAAALAQGTTSVVVLGLLNLVMHYGCFLGRFMLMLHYASHLTIFTSPLLNGMLHWFLPPLFGLPCGVYKSHHVIMHHIENNHGYDISATDFYQRDSKLHFLRYWFRFSVLIWMELPLYCIRKRRWKNLREVLAGLSIWLAGIYLFSRLSFSAAMLVFVVPSFPLLLAFSFGNWSQHVFVDPSDNRNNYALAYNCIDSGENRKTFNDGYHILHHLDSRRHWSELPSVFHASIDKHVEQGALTFRNADNNMVGLLVMTGNLRRLASEHYVHLGDKDSAPLVEEVVAKLRRRLQPVKDPGTGRYPLLG